MGRAARGGGLAACRGAEAGESNEGEPGGAGQLWVSGLVFCVAAVLGSRKWGWGAGRDSGLRSL